MERILGRKYTYPRTHRRKAIRNSSFFLPQTVNIKHYVKAHEGADINNLEGTL